VLIFFSLAAISRRKFRPRLYLLAVALVAHFSDGAMRMIGGWPQDEEL